MRTAAWGIRPKESIGSYAEMPIPQPSSMLEVNAIRKMPKDKRLMANHITGSIPLGNCLLLPDRQVILAVSVEVNLRGRRRNRAEKEGSTADFTQRPRANENRYRCRSASRTIAPPNVLRSRGTTD